MISTNNLFLYRQRGFSLVTAIFVVVVMALLGVYMVTIGGAQRVTAAYAIQNTRAEQAARAGVEWAIHTVLNNPLGTSCGLDPAIITTPVTLNDPGLQGFQVNVGCRYTLHRETGSDDEVFVISSVASNGSYGNPYFFSRTVQASVTNAP